MEIGALKVNFARKGLNSADLVILSGWFFWVKTSHCMAVSSSMVFLFAGAHTIGASHCSAFSNRLYNFTGKGDADPSLDRAYQRTLKKACKPGDVNTVVEMDPGSAVKFDNSYYRGVVSRKGLFVSDQALLHDGMTENQVQRFIRSTPRVFPRVWRRHDQDGKNRSPHKKEGRDQEALRPG